MASLPEVDVDCVIVGGGLSGLAAADLLSQHRRGDDRTCPFEVIEARDRLGGRVRTAHEAYGWLDRGGAYVALTQVYVQHCIRRFGLRTDRTYMPPDARWRFQLADGRVLTLTSGEPPAFPGGRDTFELLAVLDRLTCDLRADLEDPRGALNAAVLDRMSVADFIRDYGAFAKDDPSLRMNDLTRQAFTVSIRSAYSAEPDELSALFLLDYAAKTGSYAMLADILGGDLSAEGNRLLYGASELVEALAASIEQARIRRGVEVTSIRDLGTHCEVVTTKGTRRCRKVIVAVAPPVARRIRFAWQPAHVQAGALREELHQHMFMGRTIKGFLVYRRPWWREAGFTGNTMAYREPDDLDEWPLDWALDTVWDPEQWDIDRPHPSHPCTLMTFIVGKAADLWRERSREARREALIRQLVTIYGEEARTEVVDYVEHDFRTSPWSMGGPAGLLGPGHLLRLAPALRRPVGNVHFAATESATGWCGYMDGALQAGIRAALEVL